MVFNMTNTISKSNTEKILALIKLTGMMDGTDALDVKN
jgi:hypothetical protein